MNQITILGRLSSDVELRQTQSGLSVAIFNVAVNNGKDKDGNERPADFIPCKAWKEKAEFISRYFSKGKMILLTGKFKTDKYTHKQYSDVTIYSSYILVDNVEFCGDKSTEQQAKPQQARKQPVAASVPDDYEILLNDDEMPF